MGPNKAWEGANKIWGPVSTFVPPGKFSLLGPATDHQLTAYTNLLYITFNSHNQRWSPRGHPWPRARPRGHILKSLALASKVKSLALASKSQVLENCLVLGSRTELFFEQLKFYWKTPEISRKICKYLFCRGGVEDTKLEAKAKDANASALQKKRVFTNIFQAISSNKRFPKIFSGAPQNFNNSKISAVLEPRRTGQFSRT